MKSLQSIYLKINNIDNFGNLCLISVSKNAKLNNHPPKSKKEYYLNGKYDSLKQHIMMEKSDNWDENSIEKHNSEMLEILELITQLSHIKPNCFLV